jgi:hypothetical protein
MPIIDVGLDVHKETIAVALAEAGKRSEVREHGKIANTPAAVTALAAKLARGGHELRFCYEAGPCGYGIQRHLTAAEHGCVVVAPSLLSVSGSDQPRATVATGGLGPSNPRHGVESPGTAVPPLSQACPRGEAGDCGDRRDRARTGGFRLGNR